MRFIDELKKAGFAKLQLIIIAVPISVELLFLLFPRFFFPAFEDYQFFFGRPVRNTPIIYVYPFGMLAGISLFWKNKKAVTISLVLMTISHLIVIYFVWLSGNVRVTGVWNNFMAFIELVVILPISLLIGHFASKYFTGAPNRSLN